MATCRKPSSKPSEIPPEARFRETKSSPAEDPPLAPPKLGLILPAAAPPLSAIDRHQRRHDLRRLRHGRPDYPCRVTLRAAQESFRV
ncbi:hypothetical protein BHE74_00035131 [Ensete ventricosum]|nr:hypothetical protein BHE74_00035131 [Ensete ventricosum]